MRYRPLVMDKSERTERYSCGSWDSNFLLDGALGIICKIWEEK